MFFHFDARHARGTSCFYTTSLRTSFELDTSNDVCDAVRFNLTISVFLFSFQVRAFLFHTEMHREVSILYVDEWFFTSCWFLCALTLSRVYAHLNMSHHFSIFNAINARFRLFAHMSTKPSSNRDRLTSSSTTMPLCCSRRRRPSRFMSTLICLAQCIFAQSAAVYMERPLSAFARRLPHSRMFFFLLANSTKQTTSLRDARNLQRRRLAWVYRT